MAVRYTSLIQRDTIYIKICVSKSFYLLQKKEKEKEKEGEKKNQPQKIGTYIHTLIHLFIYSHIKSLPHLEKGQVL